MPGRTLGKEWIVDEGLVCVIPFELSPFSCSHLSA